MSDAKFTPGPWVVHVTPWAKGWTFSVGRAELGVRHTLAKIVPINEHSLVSIQEREANAELISAAPDLYAALETVLSVRMLDNLTDEQHASVKAALAKARGEPGGESE